MLRCLPLPCVHAASKAHAGRRTLSAMMLADVTVVLLAAPSIMTPFMRCTINCEPLSIVGSICMLVRSVDCAPAAWSSERALSGGDYFHDNGTLYC